MLRGPWCIGSIGLIISGLRELSVGLQVLLVGRDQGSDTATWYLLAATGLMPSDDA